MSKNIQQKFSHSIHIAMFSHFMQRMCVKKRLSFGQQKNKRQKFVDNLSNFSRFSPKKKIPLQLRQQKTSHIHVLF
jgi:hypothetical protein